MKFTWNNRESCDQMTEQRIGDTVTVSGWVDTTRDHGHLLFIHLRDRSGTLQIVCDENKNQGIYKLSKALKSESVISVTGTIQMRSKETINSGMLSGTIELIATGIDVLSKAKNPHLWYPKNPPKKWI